MEKTTKNTRSRRRTTIIGAAAAVVVVSSVASALLFKEPSADPASPAHDASVQSALDSLVADDGFPGAIAAVTDADGDVTDYVAGVSDLGSDAPPPADGLVRIASNTKMYTSVTVLQLVDEKLVDLDEPVETYLPGLLRGDGIDGSRITVRQLLQHTSGLPNYTSAIAGDLFAIRDTYLSPRDLVDLALSMPASFAPGTSYQYSNTNYIVAGLLVEKLTGRPFAEQVEQRIIEPLGLDETFFPGVGDSAIPGPHATGYNNDAEGKLKDITETDPSWAWAAGQIIASPSDVNRFMRALVGGELLSPDTLAQMQTTVEGDELWEGAGYGLGLIGYPLSCGGVAWGHGGDISGFETRNAVDDTGRAVTVAVTALPGALSTDEDTIIATIGHVEQAVDTALCAGR